MDAERVCLALDVAPDELSNVSKQEAARHLRAAAELLDDPEAGLSIVFESTQRAGHWLMLADEFEREWDRQHSERTGGNDDTDHGGESDEQVGVAARRQRTEVEDWSA